MDFLPQLPSLIDEHIKQSVKTQTEQLVAKAFEKSKNINCDFFGVADAMYKKYGKKWDDYQKQNPDYTRQIEFEIVVNVGD